MRNLFARLLMALTFIGMAPVAAAQDTIARAQAAQAVGQAQSAQATATAARTASAQLQSALIGPNLFLPEDPDIALGFYTIASDGRLLPSGAYNTTGFIPVEPGKSYFRSYYIGGTRQILAVNVGQWSWYDANKAYISQQSGATNPLVPPAGAAYVRVNVPKAFWQNFQFTAVATLPTTYTTRFVPQPANPFQAPVLRQTHYRLTKLAIGEATQLVINVPGDSYSFAAERYVRPMTDYLTAKFGDAGGGWSGFSWLSAGGTAPWTSGNQPSLAGNARPSLYGLRVYGSVTNAYFTEATADLGSATLSINGAAYEQDFPAAPVISGLDLHYVGTGACGIRYGYGATQGALPNSWASLGLNAASGVTTVVPLSLSGIAQPGTLRIEWVSGTCKLAGVNMKSAASGVRVNKIAATGSAVTQWATVNQDNFQTSFAALGGHLTIYMTGTNDQSANLTPTGGSSFQGNLSIVVNRFRGVTSSTPATTAMDVLIATPPENQRTANNVAMTGYAVAARQLAYQQRFAFLDMQPAFGDPYNSSTYGAAGEVPLYNSDLIHPDPLTGGRLMMAEMLRVVLPFGGTP